MASEAHGKRLVSFGPLASGNPQQHAIPDPAGAIAPEVPDGHDQLGAHHLLLFKLMIATRPILVQQAFRLEYLTLAWVLIEAAVAIGSGVAARSITLLAFGVDSLIELASAAVLIWRLRVELHRGEGFAEDAEQKA